MDPFYISGFEMQDKRLLRHMGDQKQIIIINIFPFSKITKKINKIMHFHDCAQEEKWEMDYDSLKKVNSLVSPSATAPYCSSVYFLSMCVFNLMPG